LVYFILSAFVFDLLSSTTAAAVMLILILKRVKSKAIFVTGHGGQ
jgi:hypothetical protein